MARAGLYREQIQLVYPGAAVPDGIGGLVTAGDGQKVSVWARIQQLRGAQLLALGREINAQVYKISIRYRADAHYATQVFWQSQALKVLSQVTDERRTEIMIYAIDAQ